ncbi:hypothetical protein OJF2_42010 [Aquisphaera giovannonii]|uniref:RNA polymerase sigma factor n=1 Tax=Aquisphaera giovannonii TaxID=406548 RepID=A0A5B9W4R0_9BACT|nr:sigma-70 family RNA polymerase sigma factor [Aquisphaera giovannonii]QEH35646.1 hypothetical protein OJF2_42010 [Aquisphaera giovannonii]
MGPGELGRVCSPGTTRRCTTWSPTGWTSEAALRSEAKARLQDVLNAKDAPDGEVLALRHFDQLTQAEALEVMGIKRNAAGMHSLLARKRLKDGLSSLPEG